MKNYKYKPNMDSLLDKIQNQLYSNDTLYFYKWNGSEKKFFFLSNFYYLSFVDNNNKKWGTSESYFQSQKFNTNHLINEDDIKNFKEFKRILRKNFQDAPAIVFKLAAKEAKGVSKAMTAFMGIDQENTNYKNKTEKEKQFDKYIKKATEINAKYKIKKAPNKLSDINFTLWNSEKPSDIKKGNRIYSMISALVYKFQNDKIRQKLLNTGDKLLIENNNKDNYWGVGYGYGKNTLGKLLVILRNIIRQDPNISTEKQIENLINIFIKLKIQ